MGKSRILSRTGHWPGALALALLLLLAALAIGACGDGEASESLVYAAGEEGARDIYIIEGNHAPRRLTADPSDDFYPRLSPDGKVLAFISNREGIDGLFVMDVKGGPVVRISEGPGNVSYPRWSPDGKTLAYLSSGEAGIAHIFLAQVADPRPQRLRQGSFEEGPPAWSPDARWIAFSLRNEEGKGRGIVLRNPSGINEIPLTEGPDYNPSWAPDSRSIAFESVRDGDAEIYSVELGKGEIVGAQPRRLTNHPEADTMPAWSPDGKWVAFITTRDGNPEIYVVNQDGSQLRRLTLNEVREEDLTWSKKGRLAFVSYFHGNADIFVMEADGSRQSRQTDDPEPDTQPHW